jgi:hypothetical protein
MRELIGLFIYSPNDVLDCIHLGLLEIGFTALRTNSRRHVVEADVNIFSIDMKWRFPTHHPTLAISASH